MPPVPPPPARSGSPALGIWSLALALLGVVAFIVILSAGVTLGRGGDIALLISLTSAEMAAAVLGLVGVVRGSRPGRRGFAPAVTGLIVGAIGTVIVGGFTVIGIALSSAGV